MTATTSYSPEVVGRWSGVFASALMVTLFAASPAQADPPHPNDVGWCGGDCQVTCINGCDSGHHYEWRSARCQPNRLDWCDDGYHCDFGPCGRDRERVCNTAGTGCSSCARGYHYDSFGVCRASCTDDTMLGDDDAFTCSWDLENCGGPGQRSCSNLPSCRYGTSYYGLVTHGTLTCEIGGKYAASCGTPFAYSGSRLDVTFLVATDLEMGRDANKLAYVKKQVKHLNDVYAGKVVLRWPSDPDKPWSGQQIPKPKAMVVTGDLTGYGKKAERGQFRYFYETGQPNAVKMPVYPGLGNHDQEAEASRFYEPMREYIRERVHCSGMETSYHDGSLNYSWDWGDLHLVQLNTWADDDHIGLSGGKEWLEKDLAAAGTSKQILLFQHYPLYDDIAGDWWSAADKTTFKGIIDGYNVKAIFTGHAHNQPLDGRDWNGYKEYRGRSGGHGDKGGFLLVRVTGSQMRVAYAEWQGDGPLQVKW